MTKWVARNSDSAWIVQGFGDPALIHSQPSNYTLVECPADDCPNPRTERYDAASPSKRRSATSAEIKQYNDVMVRDKDLARKAIQALAIAVHKRFKTQIPTDSTTAAQWNAAIAAEWDAL